MAGSVRSALAKAFSGAFSAALLVLILLFAPVAGSSTMLWVGGTDGTLGKLIPDDLFGTPETFLGGAYQDDDLVHVDYPGSIWPITGLFDPPLGTSIEIGAANLVARAQSTPGPLILMGISQGAMVVQQVQAVLDGDPAIPSDTTFIIIGNPNLGLLKGLSGVRVPVLGYVPRPLPETRFDTIVVVNEYDGWSDPIARWWNPLTVLNAVMALAYVHPFAQQTDLSAVPPQNITTTVNSRGGTTATYFAPTVNLPLTMPLRQLQVPTPVVDAIDAVLRPLIDAGYDRQPRGGGSTSLPGGDRRTAALRAAPVVAAPVKAQRARGAAASPPRAEVSRPAEESSRTAARAARR